MKRAPIIILFLIALLSTNVLAVVCTPIDSDIMLAIDNTASIKGLSGEDQIDHSSAVIDAINTFINKASDLSANNNRVGIVSFGWYSTLLSSLSDVPSKRDQLINSVDNLLFDNDETAICAGLSRTLQAFNDNSRDVNKYTILFTDGLPTEGCVIGQRCTDGHMVCMWINPSCDESEKNCYTIPEYWSEECVEFWPDSDDCKNTEEVYHPSSTSCVCPGDPVKECNYEEGTCYGIYGGPIDSATNYSNRIKNLGIKIYVIDTSGTHSSLLKNLASDSSKYFDLSNYNDLSTTFTNIFQEVSCKPPIITVTSPQATSYTPYNSNTINFIAQSTAKTGVWKINIDGTNYTIPSSYYTTYGVNYPKSFNDGTYTIKFYAQESESTKGIWSETSPFIMTKTSCGDGIVQPNYEQCDFAGTQSCAGINGYTNGNLKCSSCTFDYSACFKIYWADPATNQLISSANSNSTVKIIRSNFGTPGATASIDIYKKGDTSATATIIGTVDSSGTLVGNWKIPLIIDDIYTFKVNGVSGNDLDINQIVYCGDGKIDQGEKCDITFGTQTCSTFGYTNGNLVCTPTCNINHGSCFNALIVNIINPANNAAFVENQDIAIKATSNIPVKKWNYTLLITTPTGGITLKGEDSGTLSQLFDSTVVKVSPIGQCKLTVWGTTSDGSAAKDEVDCTITAPTSVPQPFWTNLLGEIIDKAEVGDTVKLIYLSTSLALGNFEIWELDLLGNDAIRTGNNSLQGTANADDSISTFWTITLEDLAKTADFKNFIFRIVGFEDSDELEILPSGNDDPIVIQFISPNCGDYFNTSETLQITINATDRDDIITGELKVLKDDTLISDYQFTNGVTNVTLQLASDGNYKLSAEGTNSKNKAARKISNIMVIDPIKSGRYIAACVDEPNDFSDLQVGIVKFNANKTVGINYTVPGIYTKIPKEQIEFYWEFSDGRISPYIGPDPLSNEFHKIYLPVKDSWASLNAKLK